MRTRNSIRLHLLLGVMLCLLLIGGAGGWAATAHLAGAVIAPASVVVETDVKKVQHQTGGIVAALNVKNGAEVKAGDVLIRLDDTLTGANLAMISKMLDELTGRRARLLAEQESTDKVSFPGELRARAAVGTDAARIIAGERRLFEARKAAMAGQTAQLRERIAQLGQEVSGVNAQLKAKSQEIAYIGEELRGVESLHERNLLPINRVTALRRDATRLEGERGQLVSAIAQAKGRIAENELKIIQLGQDRRTEVLDALRQIEGRLGELMERRISAEDQFKRTEIRAPQDGIVHELRVHTVGGVIGPGETLMHVVPQSDGMSLEAKVAPINIDQIRPGQKVRVRFTAFDQTSTPQLEGSVSIIAANVTTDPHSRQPFYAIRITVPDGEIARLKGLQLVPGMPAEAHFETQTRTALSYLTKPLTDQFARAFRDD